jgi:hypothetical protein
MARLTVKTRIFLLTLFVVVALGFLWLSHARGLEAMREYQAVLVVGYASLVYWDEYGKAPHSIEDLLQAGLLCRRDDEYVETPGFSLTVPLQYARRVTLSFPESTDAVVLQGGFVRSKHSGERLVCIGVDSRPVENRDRDWAYLWFQVASGRLTGNDRLDELVRERRGASSRPATAPSDG